MLHRRNTANGRCTTSCDEGLRITQTSLDGEPTANIQEVATTFSCVYDSASIGSGQFAGSFSTHSANLVGLDNDGDLDVFRGLMGFSNVILWNH